MRRTPRKRGQTPLEQTQEWLYYEAVLLTQYSEQPPIMSSAGGRERDLSSSLLPWLRSHLTATSKWEDAVGSKSAP
jgi:hypothetical protein